MIIEFKEYQNSRAAQIADENYDCEEIAEDLVGVYKERALVYKIYTKPLYMFNVKEHGELLEVTHHYFVIVDDQVLDPRWSKEPIPFNEYLQQFHGINTEEAMVDIRILLIPSFNPYNANVAEKAPFSASTLFGRK